jgi:predicted PurR-regulated permease PerM
LERDLRSQIAENAWILIPVLLLLILITYFLFPLMDGIILGVVFAYVGRPIKERFGKRERLGSVVATTAIVLPIALILGLGGVEVVSQLNWAVENQAEIIRRAGSFLAEVEMPLAGIDILPAIYEIPPAIYDDLTGSLRTMIELLARVLSSFPIFSYGMSIILTGLNLIASIYVCYFLLMDGRKLAAGIATILPTENLAIYKKYEERIDSILSGIFIGAIYTSILSGILSVMVFYAFGIPNPFALAALVFISGLIPVLSSWLVIIPISAYRYFDMSPFDGILFFVVSSAMIYIPSDLIIRPYIVSMKSTIHPLLVVLAFVGGVLVAGLGGFFLAPALMGVVVGVYQIHKEEKMAMQIGEGPKIDLESPGSDGDFRPPEPVRRSDPADDPAFEEKGN